MITSFPVGNFVLPRTLAHVGSRWQLIAYGQRRIEVAPYGVYPVVRGV
jgi:hypothetical protein